MLGARNSSQIDEFYTRGRQEDLSVFYISQSYFALPRQSIRNNTDRRIHFKPSLRDVEFLYKDIGGYDMKYDEFKAMCHETWSEKFNYLCFDMTKKTKVKIVFSMETKPHILNLVPKVNLSKNI